MAARDFHHASTVSDGQRECARGEWCSASARDAEGAWHPALSYQAFCPADTSQISRDLQALPVQYLYLGAEIGTPRAEVSQIRVPFGPKVPIRLDIDALQRAMTEVLSCWHERVAAVASLTFPDRDRDRRGAVAVRDAARTLRGHLSTLLGLPPEPMRRAITLHNLTGWPDDTPGIVHTVFAEINPDLSGADAGLEILHLRYICRAILGETRDKPEELYGVPCRMESCDMLALRRAELPAQPDEPVWWSECAVCDDKMTEDEYRDWTRRYARWARESKRVPATLENLPVVA